MSQILVEKSMVKNLQKRSTNTLVGVIFRKVKVKWMVSFSYLIFGIEA